MNKVLKYARKYRFYITALIIVIGIIWAIATFSKSSDEAVDSLEYEEVNSVPGITFEVPKAYADQSQAVLEISSKLDFSNSQTYSYKNGEDLYLLFNLKRMIVVVKKGTNFNLEDGTKGLDTNSLNGIWFEPISNVSKDGNKASVNVNAEVVITNDAYNDFTGTLTTVVNDGVEYALFVGSLQDAEIIETVTSSFSVAKDNKADNDIYAVDIETESVEEVAYSPSEDEEEIAEEKTSSPAEITSEDTENIESTGDAENEVNDTESEDNDTEIVTSDIGKNDTLTVINNQKTVEKVEGKAYTSSIYSMLSIGNTGIMTAYSGTGVLEYNYIKATKILDRDETNKAIQKYIRSGKAYYDSVNIPLGTHLEACVYDAKKQSEDTYINVTLRGLDGEDLRFNGIIHDKRTYDILSDTESAGWITNNIVYYFVPNGCTEYVLQFGDEDESCYYHIKVER